MAITRKATLASFGLFIAAFGCGDDSAAHAKGGGGEDDGRPDSGLWLEHELDESGGGEGIDQETLQELANLPYAGGANVAPKDDKVRYLNAELTYPGMNLLVSGHGAEAVLMDMKGNPRHTWHCDPSAVLADHPGYEHAYGTFWRRAHVMPNGDLLAVFDGVSMIKLDRESKLLWKSHGNYHHDLFVHENGDIWTLSRHERKEHPRFESEAPILEDFICVLGPDGKEKQRISVLDAFLDSEHAGLLEKTANKGDILHTNTIEWMDGKFADRHPMFAKGNLLISVPTINTIAVVNPTAKKVVWAMEGPFVFQHEPTVLADGNILLFDNRGQEIKPGKTGASRVIEIDPLTKKIVRTVWGDEHRIASGFLGSCARLPNGNTLIIESTKGHALEVTADGGVCWDFYNPHVTDDELYIAALLEIVRIPVDTFTADFNKVINPVESSDVDTDEAQRMLEKLKGK